MSSRAKLTPRLAMGVASIAALALLIPTYLVLGLPWPHAIAAGLIVVLPGVVFGWVIWRTAPRIGVQVPRLPLHAATAATVAAAWVAAIAGLSWLVEPKAAIAFLRNGAAWQFIGGLVLYAAVAAAAEAAVAQVRLHEREAAAAAAELQALRGQLDPHFLFNTLHSLSQLVREDPAVAEDAIERFGGLMRRVIDANRDGQADSIPLEQELEFLHDYIALERIRLGTRLRVDEAIEDEALDCVIPPFLLEPLVENAIRHGIATRAAGGTLRLRGDVAEGLLRLEVSNEGEEIPQQSSGSSTGLGLQLVRRQLMLVGGEMRIATAFGQGFSVNLSLPVRRPNETL